VTQAAAAGPPPPLPREHLLPPPLLIGAGRHCLEERGRNTSGKEQGRPPTCSSGKEKGRPSMAQHACRKGRAAIRRPTAAVAATTERVCLYPTRRRRTHATVGLYPTLEKMEKTDGILYLNGGGGGAACSRRRWRWREGVAAREEARARKKRAREEDREFGSLRIFTQREINLSIVRRWGIRMGNHWRIFF